MAATTKVPLGASTTNRKWYVDLDNSATGTPSWLALAGITELTPGVEGSLQDDSDFDGEGWGSQVNTMNAWTLEGKVRRGVLPGSTPPVYDPAQEILRLAAAETGLANVVHVRWYEMEPEGPRVEAYEGYAAVTWSEDGGGVDAISIVSFTLTGRGKRTVITHPADAGAGG
ncbi:major tail protein [Microbacterium phage Phonegingi]|nr:major tail protein [Microbacterium phage Phonegingi]